jgi:hypothetical protein
MSTEIDKSDSSYKCVNCLYVIRKSDIVKNGEQDLCPACLSHVDQMCSRDHCHCSHDVVDGIAYCLDCGMAICPRCGSHDVAQISRVTGYLQEVSGWNAGKRQELRDRVRYEVAVSEVAI